MATAMGGAISRTRPPARPQPADLVSAAADVAQRGAHLREQALSRLGRRDAAGRPREQPDAEPLLEPPDGVADADG